MPTELINDVRRYLAEGQLTATSAHVAEAILASGEIPGAAAVSQLVTELQSELVGAGPLEPFLNDPQVTDVLVNGHGSVWVDRGSGLEELSIRFRDEVTVRRLAQRLAGLAGRRLDDASPFVDARLPDGSRLHAIVPPLSAIGTCISIRVPRKRDFSLVELVEAGALPEEGIVWLQALMTSKSAFLISGGTGTGKTTLLSALLATIPSSERILIVEDSGELNPGHDHVVRLEARPANVEGQGKVELRDLLRQALRMRPDRIVVGEVRGAEVVDLLAALNTGHEGGCGTVHANSAADVPARLEALALAAGLGREALHAQVGAGLDALVHLDRDRNGKRRITGINVLIPDGEVDAASVGVAHAGRFAETSGSCGFEQFGSGHSAGDGVDIGTGLRAAGIQSVVNRSIPAVKFLPSGVAKGPGYENLVRRLGDHLDLR